MIIDGRGKDDSVPYDELEKLITRDACLLEDKIEVLVDREGLAKKINILATLAGYDTKILPREGYWVLGVDVSRRRCP